MKKNKINLFFLFPVIAVILIILSIHLNSIAPKTVERNSVTVNVDGTELTSGYDTYKEYSEDKTAPDSNGMPNYIKAEDTAVIDNTETLSNNYCGNKNSKIYHLPGCSSIKKTKEENKVYFKTKDECINNGYKPCSRCKP